MSTRLARCVVLAALIGTTGASVAVVSADPARDGVIHGTAVTALRRPLADHLVRLRSLDTVGTVRTARTNSTGGYEFSGVRPGMYYVEIVDRANRILTTDGPIAVAGRTSQRPSPARLTIARVPVAAPPLVPASTAPLASATPQAAASAAASPQSPTAQDTLTGRAAEVVRAASAAGITGIGAANRPLPSAPR
jgi:hypothetical protein